MRLTGGAIMSEQPWLIGTQPENVKAAYKELIDTNQKIMGILLIVLR